MPFLAAGLEHRTAPLAVRERVAPSPDAAANLLRRLIDNPAVAEVVLLATCNRTELYLFGDHDGELCAAAAAALSGGDPRILPYAQYWRDASAAEHLFRVAAGLESQLLGEPEILSQVREALVTAQDRGTIGPNLHALFRAAIACTRRARASTALGTVDVSFARTAVEVAERAFGSLLGRSALVIGAGRISRLAMAELAARSLDRLYVANRTPSAAADLAEQWGAQAVALGDLSQIMGQVDLILSATSARGYVLTPEVIGRERRSPLHIVDLAVPRDVDPAVGGLDGVTIHDLETLTPAELETRWNTDIRAIEGIIAAEVHEFVTWTLTRRVVPVIASLRSHVETVAQQEMRRIEPQIAGLDERERAAVESLTRRLIDKMFHHLVMRLRLAAQTDPSLVDAAEFFFLHGEGSLFDHAATSSHEAELTS